MTAKTIDSLIVAYNELDELLQYNQLKEEDYLEYIEIWEELKRRGYEC